MDTIITKTLTFRALTLAALLAAFALGTYVAPQKVISSSQQAQPPHLESTAPVSLIQVSRLQGQQTARLLQAMDYPRHMDTVIREFRLGLVEGAQPLPEVNPQAEEALFASIPTRMDCVASEASPGAYIGQPMHSAVYPSNPHSSSLLLQNLSQFNYSKPIQPADIPAYLRPLINEALAVRTNRTKLKNVIPLIIPSAMFNTNDFLFAIPKGTPLVILVQDKLL
jgi:hypothetical protein